MSDTDDTDGTDDARLTAVCRDGTTVGCVNFEAVAGGVLLTEDLERDRVFGFVPNDEPRYVLPTETVERTRDERADGEFEDPLMRLPGAGSRYAKRLRDEGYDSIEDLAGADPGALADATGASESRTSEWVERAERTDDLREGAASPSDGPAVARTTRRRGDATENENLYGVTERLPTPSADPDPYPADAGRAAPGRS